MKNIHVTYRQGGDSLKYTLKELRAKHNLTQLDLAKKVGVSIQTYNAWESDFGVIKISQANKIANILGVTLDDIFFTPLHEKNSCKNVEH